MKKHPVVHFELPCKDRERVKKFYSEALGWDMRQMGEEYGNYIMAITTETEMKDGMERPKEPGAINGGVFKSTDDPISQYPSFVVATDDIEASIKSVIDAGGTQSGKTEDIPNVGKFASVIDTEGNRFSIMQPIK